MKTKLIIKLSIWRFDDKTEGKRFEDKTEKRKKTEDKDLETKLNMKLRIKGFEDKTEGIKIWLKV